MKRPKAVIINETEKGKKHLIELLKGAVKDNSGLTFDIITDNNVTDPDSLRRNSKLLGGDVYFIHEEPEREKWPLAPKIAKALVERGVRGGMTLTTERTREEPYDVTKKQPGYKHFNGWLPKTDEQFNAGEVSRKVEEFRKRKRDKEGAIEQESKFFQTMSVGILGLGKLGRGVCRGIKAKPYIKVVNAFTDFAKGEYEKEIIPNLAFKKDERKKFKFHNTLEGVIEANPDVLIIATGEHGIQYGAYNQIKDLTERLMHGAYPKVKAMLQAIKDRDYQGPIFMESNAVGPLLQVAKRMGLDPSNLTSITPDVVRHNTHLLELLQKQDPTLKYSDIILGTIGEHGKEISRLREGKVRDIPLTEASPEFKDPKYRRQFNHKARQIGLTLVEASRRLRDTYGGITEMITDALESFAYFQRNVPSAYSYFPEADCFIGVPSVAEYPLKIKSVATHLRNLSQDREVLTELGKTIAYQIALADKYHPKS